MKLLLHVALVLALCASVANAQKIDIEAIKSKAANDADEFAEVRALMRDQDANLRLAAFDALVSHGDPSLYEIAVSMGLADVDEIIRARALWEILVRTKNLQFLVDPEGSVTENDAQKRLYDTYQGRMNFQVGNALKQLNCVNMYYVKDECVGGYNLGVNGTLVSFIYANANLDGSLRLDTDGVLRGTLRNTRMKLDFPVEVHLR